MKKIDKSLAIAQVVFFAIMSCVVAFWLIGSIVNVGIQSWQVALVGMQICSILLVKISIKELKNENDTE